MQTKPCTKCGGTAVFISQEYIDNGREDPPEIIDYYKCQECKHVFQVT